MKISVSFSDELIRIDLFLSQRLREFSRTNIQKMINNGSDHFTEIGPGKVLQGLNRKIDKNVYTKGIQTYEDILNYNV